MAAGIWLSVAWVLSSYCSPSKFDMQIFDPAAFCHLCSYCKNGPVLHARTHVRLTFRPSWAKQTMSYTPYDYLLMWVWVQSERQQPWSNIEDGIPLPCSKHCCLLVCSHPRSEGCVVFASKNSHNHWPRTYCGPVDTLQAIGGPHLNACWMFC
jgi:hypothetical protein